MARVMSLRPPTIIRSLMNPASDYLAARWLFLRALALIYFSAFYSLIFQIRGLIGPRGLLPAGIYLEAVAKQLGSARYWYAPTLLWLGSGNRALEALCWIGMAAAVLAFVNVWPRLSFFICLVMFLSFIAAAQDFADYQSDGMLLAAGLLVLFFAPPGLWPGWGADHPPSRASLYLLRWEWFRIYFESGLAKMLGHDPEWRNFTAMKQYYQNGPLPSWIGWYAQQLPHWFQAATVALTLGIELGLVWLVFLPRRVRLILFCIVTPFQIGIILTGNYAFLNYFVLSAGILLVDDGFLARLLSTRVRSQKQAQAAAADSFAEIPGEPAVLSLGLGLTPAAPPASASTGSVASDNDNTPQSAPPASTSWNAPGNWRSRLRTAKYWLTVFLFAWIFYATVAILVGSALPQFPVTVLAPFRFANQYALFAWMTRGRYEIEFQGSADGKTWTPYPFRYKPQNLDQPPGLYAPYQPRFDWNLWFASLGSWREAEFVLRTEELLLTNDPDVLALFAGNPFPQNPPLQVRAILWQYWFTDLATKRATGRWWRRQEIGLYAPEIERLPDGRFAVVQMPGAIMLQPRP